MNLGATIRMRAIYALVCKYYAIIPPFVSVGTFFYDAPFGRFAPTTPSIFTLDGRTGWIVMELFAPITFLYAFLTSPLTILRIMPVLHPSYPPTLLAILFLVHYANRAILSPLRTPSRSKTSLSVTLSGIFFNVVNGTLMGAYLSSAPAQKFLKDSFERPTFYIGILIWALGFVGNIVHDEILFDIRREAAKKREAAEKEEKETKKPVKQGEYYGIPQGYLYNLISYPNYLCEWVEWFGFALAASPIPSIKSFTMASPPWLFAASEVFLMISRAYRGHQWYLKKFPEYPKNRKAVIPYVF